MAQCSTCGASLKPGATRCVKCGTVAEVAAPASAPQPIQPQQYAQAPQYAPPPPQYAAPQQPQVVYVQQVPSAPKCSKSKTTAGVLGLLLGSLGAHKFYLGKIGQGILYLLFCWTYIPGIIGFFEGLHYLTMKEEAFCQKFADK